MLKLLHIQILNLPTFKIASQLWQKDDFLAEALPGEQNSCSQNSIIQPYFFSQYINTYISDICISHNIWLYIPNFPTCKTTGELRRMRIFLPRLPRRPEQLQLTFPSHLTDLISVEKLTLTFKDVVSENLTLIIFLPQYKYLGYYLRAGWKQKILHSSRRGFPAK